MKVSLNFVREAVISIFPNREQLKELLVMEIFNLVLVDFPAQICLHLLDLWGGRMIPERESFTNHGYSTVNPEKSLGRCSNEA